MIYLVFAIGVCMVSCVVLGFLLALQFEARLTESDFEEMERDLDIRHLQDYNGKQGKGALR